MTVASRTIGNCAYKVEYWPEDNPSNVSVDGLYSSKGIARGRLTSILSGNRYCKTKTVGRVLGLSGEWKEVEPSGN